MTKKTIALLVAAAVVLIGIVYDYYSTQSLRANGVFVIGTIDKRTGARGGVRIFLHYTYKGKKYHRDCIHFGYDDRKMGGQRYFIKIDSVRQSQLHVYYEFPVPDSITYTPFYGWDSIPLPYALKTGW